MGHSQCQMIVWITSGKDHLNGLKRDVAVYVAVLRNTSKSRNVLRNNNKVMMLPTYTGTGTVRSKIKILSCTRLHVVLNRYDCLWNISKNVSAVFVHSVKVNQTDSHKHT